MKKKYKVVIESEFARKRWVFCVKTAHMVTGCGLMEGKAWMQGHGLPGNPHLPAGVLKDNLTLGAAEKLVDKADEVLGNTVPVKILEQDDFYPDVRKTEERPTLPPTVTLDMLDQQIKDTEKYLKTLKAARARLV
jgi:hypothetical protein